MAAFVKSWQRRSRFGQTRLEPTAPNDRVVTIGEDENSVRLYHAEWNELVRFIKSGDLPAM
jgi:hypothetical protein